MRRLSGKAILLYLIVLPSLANAQVWLPDRDSREGPGISLGDSLVMHPGVGVEGGYDINPLRRNQNVEGAGRLRVTPYIDIETRRGVRRVADEGVIDATPPKIEFRMGLAGYGDWYFSKDRMVDDQDYFGVDTTMNFILFPEGNFSLLADAAYRRSLQPYESATDQRESHNITPGIGFRVRPGGGTLSLELGYRYRWLFYEDKEVAERSDKMEHDLRFITSWKMFPKTAIMTKIGFTPTTYVDGNSPNLNSLPVRAKIGLQGLITERFGLSLFVGYGASFYQPPPGQNSVDDFEGVIADGQLMFFVTPTANIRIGGQRDFQDSFYSNYYTKTGGYLVYEQMFAGMFLASLKGDVYHRDYSTYTDAFGSGYAPSTNNREEIWAGGTLLLELRVKDWLSFHASARYQGNFTDFQYETTDPTLSNIPTEFQKFEAMAGVRGHY